jgi:hypothetical protein
MKLSFTVGAAALCAFSFGQFSDNFESDTASASGTLLTTGFGGGGQNGWYNPVSGSLDESVYTYAGNALGIVNNATGGNNFLGAASANAATPYRAQHAVTLTSSGVWVMSVDFNFNFTGAPPVSNNLGSISLQPSTTNNAFQTLYAYNNNNLASPTGYRALFGFAGAGGGALTLQTDPSDANWDNLVFGHWYHQTVTWDAAANAITNTTLQDMTAGGPLLSQSPTGWFLTGGQNNALGQALATDTRLFISGGNANSTNIGGYDNFRIAPVPEPASMAALSLGVLALIRKRRKA